MNLSTWLTMQKAAQMDYLRKLDAAITRNPAYRSEAFHLCDAQMTVWSDAGRWLTGYFTASSGARFIYIPAIDPILGFDACGVLPAPLLKGLEEDFRSLYPERFAEGSDAEMVTRELLSKELSPPRKGAVREMLVESRYWAHEERLSPDRAAHTGIAYRASAFAGDEFAAGAISLGTFQEEEMLASLHRHGFDVCTEDEYEYLSGGGTRELLAEHLTELFAAARSRENSASYLRTVLANQPNDLGLYMGYDSYYWEYVKSPCLCKGGDGGACSCYGAVWLDLLALSPFYCPAEPWLEYDYIRRIIDVQELLG